MIKASVLWTCIFFLRDHLTAVNPNYCFYDISFPTIFMKCINDFIWNVTFSSVSLIHLFFWQHLFTTTPVKFHIIKYFILWLGWVELRGRFYILYNFRNIFVLRILLYFYFRINLVIFSWFVFSFPIGGGHFCHIYINQLVLFQHI